MAEKLANATNTMIRQMSHSGVYTINRTMHCTYTYNAPKLKEEKKKTIPKCNTQNTTQNQQQIRINELEKSDTKIYFHKIALVILLARETYFFIFVMVGYRNFPSILIYKVVNYAYPFDFYRSR